MAIDNAAYSAYLKSTYPADVLREMFYKDRVFLKLLKKKTDDGGNNYIIPVTYGFNESISPDANIAFNATANSSQVAFTMTYKNLFGKGTVDIKVLEQSKGNANAFAEALDYEMTNTMDNMGRDLNRQLFAAGDGKLANLKGGGAVAALTQSLANREDAVKFQKGMTVVLAETGSATQRGGFATVAGVDRNAGIITFGANLSTGVSAAYSGLAGGLGDAIFRSGSIGANEIAGLGQWLPSSNPAVSENFYGVDRSVDNRLFGARLDATGAPVREALVEAAQRAFELGGAPSVAFINPTQWTKLAKELDSMRMLTVDDKGVVGFNALVVNGYRGAIKVYAEPDVGVNDAYIIDPAVWRLDSVGDAPHLQEADGLTARVDAGANTISFRCAAYLNLSCLAPWKNARVVNLGV